jgi:LasA protease
MGWASAPLNPSSANPALEHDAGPATLVPVVPGGSQDAPREQAVTRAGFPTPTLDPTRFVPSPTPWPGIYFVHVGDTVDSIAATFDVPRDAIIALNNLPNPNSLQIGQPLHIPLPGSETPGPSFKIIPDSELVFGPAASTFQAKEYLAGRSGYLMSYRETVNGVDMSGPEIVQYVAVHNSVNPRLLLAVLEYCSGWVTNPSPSAQQKTYPFVYYQTKEGLYHQLYWAATQLDRGYYLWRKSGTDYWTLADTSTVRVGAGINAGTAGIQRFMAQMYGRADWEKAVGENGVYAIFQSMFGYPFSWSVEPLLPARLAQPSLMLPFESGITWYFTGGPHAGWDEGSSWAAIDFAPPEKGIGCTTPSPQWAVAAADGVVVRSETGMVVLDLDFDRNEHTGWTLLYLHMATTDRAPLGAVLHRGDHIGHPSCEGGVAFAAHFHFARRYNGEWIPADGAIPFNLDGWVASSAGAEYYGWLTKNETRMEACDCGKPDNALTR